MNGKQYCLMLKVYASRYTFSGYMKRAMDIRSDMKRPPVKSDAQLAAVYFLENKFDYGDISRTILSSEYRHLQADAIFHMTKNI